MIANARSSSQQGHAAQKSGTLALVPPRHSNLPVSVLSPGTLFIGADEGCEIHLDADGVQSRHALIIAGDQKILIKAIDPRTWVNDHPVTETALRKGDRLSIGPITFAVRYATTEELQEDLRRPKQEEPKQEERPQSESQQAAPAQLDLAQSEPPQVVQEPVVPTLAEPVQQLIEIPAEIQVPPLPAEANIEQQLPANLTVLKAGFAGIVPAEDFSLPSIQESAHLIIQKEIAAFESATGGMNEAPISARFATEQQRLNARENELKLLANELSSQSNELTSRSRRVATLETDLEHKQSQLNQDHERLVKVANEAQQKLADESARQTKLWKEWDATFQRSSAEIKAQFETIGEQRESIRQQNALLDNKRDEIQRLQSEFVKLQRDVTAEKVQTAEEIAKLQTEWAAFETERRQHLAVLKEQETQISRERQSLQTAQDELRATRQQLESVQASFTSQQSEERQRRDLETHLHDSAQSRLQEMQSASEAIKQADLQRRLELERWEKELEAQQAQLEATKESLRLEQQALDSARAELAFSAKAPIHSSTLTDANDAPISMKKDDNWSQISDTVDQLLGIYGMNSTELSHPTESVSSTRSSSGFDLGFASVATPDSFPHMTGLSEPGFRGSIEHLGAGSEDVYQLIQQDVVEMPTSNSYSGSILSEDLHYQRPSIEAGNQSSALGEVWGAFGLEPSDLSSAIAVEESIPEVKETLTDVNYRFGYLDANLDTTGDSSLDLTQPLTVAERPIERGIERTFSSDIAEYQLSAADEQPLKASDPEDPLLSLRSKLAEMFDLQAASNARTESENISEVDVPREYSELTDVSQPGRGPRGDGESFSIETSLQNQIEYSPSLESAASAPQSSVETVTTSAVTSLHSAESKAAESVAEEDPWTRRLRELSVVAQASQPSPPPVPKVDPVSAAKEQSNSTDDDAEFSVEAQLARLLGRPLNSSPPESAAASRKLPEVAVPAAEEFDPSLSIEIANDDRSHLVAAPKHKQDKDAVREEVQSFRAVAQMSARKALEKHSWKNFKSEFYFSFVLLIVSLLAAAWYIVAFYFGIEATPWKGISCVLTSTLCGMKLSGLLSRLNVLRSARSKKQVTK